VKSHSIKIMSRCDCQWLSWIPRCYGHCKPKQAQLLDLPATKEVPDEAATNTKVAPEAATAEEADQAAADSKDAEEAAIIAKVSQEVAVITKVSQEVATVARCECFISVPAVCKGLARCPLAQTSTSARVAEIKAAAAVQPEHAQLLDFSTTTKEEENVGTTKSAAQVFMEGKVVLDNAKEKMNAKLALLEVEVKLGRLLLEQTKTLKKSKEALLLQKVRVSFNKCHRFWRGRVVAAHRSFVDEQVDAAKARLGQRRLPVQFNISAMTKKIDELAPGGRYKTANPLPSSPSTSRSWVRSFAPRRLPLSPRRTRSLVIPAPPILFSVPAKQPSLMLPWTPASAWDRGDQCIVSHGDASAEVLCYDHATQLETSAEFLWDGNHDFPPYQEEVEVDTIVICQGCSLDDAKELEVETYFDPWRFGADLNGEDNYNLCFDAEEVNWDYGDAEDELEACHSY